MMGIFTREKTVVNCAPAYMVEIAQLVVMRRHDVCCRSTGRSSDELKPCVKLHRR